MMLKQDLSARPDWKPIACESVSCEGRRLRWLLEVHLPSNKLRSGVSKRSWLLFVRRLRGWLLRLPH